MAFNKIGSAYAAAIRRSDKLNTRLTQRLSIATQKILKATENDKNIPFVVKNKDLGVRLVALPRASDRLFAVAVVEVFVGELARRDGSRLSARTITTKQQVLFREAFYGKLQRGFRLGGDYLILLVIRPFGDKSVIHS